MAATREIGPVMQKLREVLLGRRHMNPLRFPQVRIEWVKIFSNRVNIFASGDGDP